MNTAIIGTGKISEEHLNGLSQIKCATVVAVCDLSPSLARHTADRFGVKHAATDYRAMLTDLKPDVVHVLTPAHTHVGMVSDCLNAGAHVIVEKPAAPSYAQLQPLRTLAQKNQCHLIEDHNYRFNAPLLAMERMLAQGRLGQVREVDVRMAVNVRAPGGRYSDANLPHPSHQLPAGVIHEFITHLCYLALSFMPDVPLDEAKATAIWSNHGGGDLFKYDDLDASIDLGDVHARIRFSCRTAPEELTVTVRGTDGWAHCNLFQPYLHVNLPRIVGKQLSPLVNQFINGSRLIGGSLSNLFDKIKRKTPYEGLHRFLQLTYHALNSGGEPPVTGQQIDRTSQLVDLLVACQRNGKAQPCNC